MNTLLLITTIFTLGPFDLQLEYAGDNRSEIERALREVPSDYARGMEWLITHMPKQDLKELSAEFLLNNCTLAYEAWHKAPWKEEISEEIFFDAILPYASVNERRENWRLDFRDRFAEITKDAKTPSEATVLLNQNIYDMVGVKYSTKRPKADQSPFESINAGLASCSGLSILLIDACRSAGVPARFVGTPLWYNESGNHSWVEVWDNGWHFTGGAEPTGNELDKGWFLDSASKATKGDSRHAIFAVTWNESDRHFPLVWLPDDKTYGAVDVTDRYTRQKKGIAEGVLVRLKAIDSTGERQKETVKILNSNAEIVFEGLTYNETADANDYLTATLKQGVSYVAIGNGDVQHFLVDGETIITLSESALSELEAQECATLFWQRRRDFIAREQKEAFNNRVVLYGDKSMPFWYTVYGNAPKGQRSLWISMHGGGGAPAEINTSQWENQKKLYSLKEGVYVAPRAPTDTWNLWHQSHIDPMFESLIQDMVIFEGVDPNRVYIIGYSAGGDGVYQLAPRMADRLAAAGMMAGHPNETIPDGLRNIGFALHVGAEDTAYNRNKIAMEWLGKLDLLHANDPDAYLHQGVIHEGKGHWMDGQDAMALPWMSQFIRNPFPKKIVWAQDDVTHSRFYWLGVDAPIARTKTVATIKGQKVDLVTDHVGVITVYLNDALLDLAQPVQVVINGEKVWDGLINRTKQAIYESMRDSSDVHFSEMSFDIKKTVD